MKAGLYANDIGLYAKPCSFPLSSTVWRSSEVRSRKSERGDWGWVRVRGPTNGQENVRRRMSIDDDELADALDALSSLAQAALPRPVDHAGIQWVVVSTGERSAICELAEIIFGQQSIVQGRTASGVRAIRLLHLERRGVATRAGVRPPAGRR